MDYTVVEMTAEELEDERVVLGGLAESVRSLADASLRTTVAPDVVAMGFASSATEVAQRQ